MDTPTKQQQYAKAIPEYLFTLSDPSTAALSFFSTLISKWNTIDYLRINKYLWLLRALAGNCLAHFGKDPKKLKKHIFAIIKLSPVCEPPGLYINYF